MEAKKKQRHTVKPEDVGVDVKPRLTTLKVSEPPKCGADITAPGVATLVELSISAVGCYVAIARRPNGSYQRACGTGGPAQEPSYDILANFRLADSCGR